MNPSTMISPSFDQRRARSMPRANVDTDRQSYAFLTPLSVKCPFARQSTLQYRARSVRGTSFRMSAKRGGSRKISPLQAVAIAAGSVIGSFVGIQKKPFLQLPPAHAVTARIVETKPSSAPLSLGSLGVKREDFVGERELRRRKTTQYSEAEQEIMELEEWEVETQWFRDLQALWAGIASIGGIFVLYKGGVMWENWIKEQEQKDMEEEIKLTGTFIDPRAVRKDEDDQNPPKKKNTPAKDPKGPGPSSDGGDSPPGGLDSLEKLFGKS